MSDVINQLTPEDFRKTFDAALFSEWKKSVEEHEAASRIMLVLQAIGVVAIFIAWGSFVGVGLYFALAIVGIAIATPKKNKRKQCQSALGIEDGDVRDAKAQYRKRVKAQGR